VLCVGEVHPALAGVRELLLGSSVACDPIEAEQALARGERKEAHGGSARTTFALLKLRAHRRSPW